MTMAAQTLRGKELGRLRDTSREVPPGYIGLFANSCDKDDDPETWPEANTTETRPSSHFIAMHVNHPLDISSMLTSREATKCSNWYLLSRVLALPRNSQSSTGRTERFPTVDWFKWHQLREREAAGELADAEQIELAAMRRVVALLDASFDAIQADSIRSAGKKHQQVIATLKQLVCGLERLASKSTDESH